MKKKRFTEQQIIGFLKEAEAGIAVKDLCRKRYNRFRVAVAGDEPKLSDLRNAM